MVLITVVPCNKDHELLQIDILKMYPTKHINSLKVGKNNIGL